MKRMALLGVTALALAVGCEDTEDPRIEMTADKTTVMTGELFGIGWEVHNFTLDHNHAERAQWLDFNGAGRRHDDAVGNDFDHRVAIALDE